MTETARMQWARETGLPPHLFDLTKEQLAKHFFDEWRYLDALLADKVACLGIDAGEPEMLKDALKVHNARIDAQRQRLANIKKEWARK